MQVISSLTPTPQVPIQLFSSVKITSRFIHKESFLKMTREYFITSVGPLVKLFESPKNIRVGKPRLGGEEESKNPASF